MQDEGTNHKSGFVSIIGDPNVGKSTLINALLKETLSIISYKPQTTRHRILGILNEENYQIVFSDTPGIITPNYKLQDAMMDFTKGAINDADILLIMTVPKQTKFKNENFIKNLKQNKAFKIILINKIDLSNQSDLNESIDFWTGIFENTPIIPISATENFNLDLITSKIKQKLPKSPPYFPKDQITDKPERFFVNEKIREKILLLFKKEIPYSVEVITEEFIEEPNIIKIRSIIMVERSSQKGIIIGHKGQQLKKIGTLARLDLETFFKKNIFLDLFVKVNKDWRKKEKQLKNFGYST